MGLPGTQAASMTATNKRTAFLRPLSRISPTVFTAMRECALKAVWKRNGKPPLPAFPQAHVGTVSHKLLAEAGQGKIKADAATVEARWHELIAETDSAISSSALDRHLAPLKNSVPDIQVRRIRTTRKALDVASQTQSLPWETSDSASLRPFGHEIPVQSTDGLVRGTIDAVFRDAKNGVIIQDYKSGTIVEPSDEGENQLKESYQIQIKMYAKLYAETFGEWPAALELAPLVGRAREVPFTKNDCSDLLDEAKTTLRLINETVKNHSIDSSESALAKPSPEACFFCQYRPGCQRYLVATARPNEEAWPLDVIGNVESVRQLGNSNMMLELATNNGSVRIPGLSPGSRHPVLPYLQQGDRAGVFSLRRRRPTAPYSESQMTTIHKIWQVDEHH